MIMFFFWVLRCVGLLEKIKEIIIIYIILLMFVVFKGYNEWFFELCKIKIKLELYCVLIKCLFL